MNKHTGWALAAILVVAGVVTLVSANNPPGAPTLNTSAWTDSMVAHSAPAPFSPSLVAPSPFAPYYTPQPFEATLAASYNLPALKLAAAPASLNRFLVSPAAGLYWSIGVPGTGAPTPLVATAPGTTVQATLAQTFEAVWEPSVTGGFRLDSDLHALYSLDVGPGGVLVFHNAWGTAPKPSGRGYLIFTYDPSSKSLRARARVSWNPDTLVRGPAPSFPERDFYVRAGAGRATLVASAAEATPLSWYEAPLNVAIPAQFNPKGTPYQPNPRVALTSRIVEVTEDQMVGPRSKVEQDLLPAYRSQVSEPGDSPATEAAASGLLDQIASHSTLRYPKAVYLAFRKALLNTPLASDDIANGRPGLLAVPYAYFTDEADDQGVQHPFLCIASYSITDKPNRLVDVRRPPGDGGGPGYASQAVTRDAALQLNLVKLPLKDYGLVNQVTDNPMVQSLLSDAHSNAAPSVYTWASTSGVGVAVDGSLIYPVLNNTLATTQNSAEITSLGNHVGQGMGLHYHADGHIALANGLQLYNLADYRGQSHPPLVGFGLDGIALYGVYEASFGSMEGIAVPLDSFGGHSHGVYGYHYHSHLVTAVTDDGRTPYVLDVLLKGAWKGRIADIPEFWDDRKGEPAYSLAQRHRYVGKGQR